MVALFIRYLIMIVIASDDPVFVSSITRIIRYLCSLSQTNAFINEDY